MNASDITSEDRPVNRFKPLRRWFPIMVLPLMILARFVPDMWTDGPSWTWAISAFVPLLLSLLLLVWWLCFSRARYYERLLGLGALIAILVVQQVLAHDSMRGPAFMVVVIPTTIAAFALGLIFFGKQLSVRRTFLALGLAALIAGVSLFARNHGVRGDFSFDLKPRWSTTSDQLLSSASRAETKKQIPADVRLISAWPSFRGAAQDGAVHGGPALDADWKAKPPRELWRIPVGPAWSSFVAIDKYLVTQEQRGDKETVACYDGDTGAEVWPAVGTHGSSKAWVVLVHARHLLFMTVPFTHWVRKAASSS